MIGGLATRSVPANVTLHCGNELCFAGGVNLFGGIIRWACMPDAKRMGPANHFVWSIEGPKDLSEILFSGHISYLDQSGLRRTKLITETHGTLA